jgi:predicted amidohydrolase
LDLCIGIGIPLQKSVGIEIGMAIFQPNIPVQAYSKMFLHPDELPYFVPGKKYKIIKIGNGVISPSICYESTFLKHHRESIGQEGQIYLASVAKSNSAMEKAISIYSTLAKEYRIHVLVVNAWGPNDDFISGGKSSVWNPDGILSGQISDANEGILIYDTIHNQSTVLNMQ